MMNSWEEMLILSCSDEYCALEVERDFAKNYSQYLYSENRLEEAKKYWAKYKEAQKKMIKLRKEILKNRGKN